MTLVLSPRLPALLGWGLLALGVDLIVSLMIAHGEDGPGTLMLFQLGGFLGWFGGLEALTWISQDSPWARSREPRNLDELREHLARELEPQPKGYMAKRMALLKRWDLAGWRGYAIRLLSGAALVFLCASTFLFQLSGRLPISLTFLGWWSLLLFIRLVPVGCAATFLAPLLLVLVPGRRPSPGETAHAGIASLAACLALFQLWVLNQPPVTDFVLAVVQAGFNILGWPYGLMIGGVFWLILSGMRGRASA